MLRSTMRCTNAYWSSLPSPIELWTLGLERQFLLSLDVHSSQILVYSSKIRQKASAGMESQLLTCQKWPPEMKAESIKARICFDNLVLVYKVSVRPIKVDTRILVGMTNKSHQTSEVASKTILMGHPGSSSHVPVVRSFFKIFVPNFHLNWFVLFTLFCRHYRLIFSDWSKYYVEIISFCFFEIFCWKTILFSRKNPLICPIFSKCLVVLIDCFVWYFDIFVCFFDLFWRK